MRRLIVMVFVLLILVQPARAQNARPLTIGTLEPLATLDPADAGDVFSWEVLTHLYTGLTRQIPGSLRYELALAASHAVSQDGLTHTFQTRPDAAFGDSTPITAQTFADSINRTIRLKSRGNAAVIPYIKAAAVDEEGALTLTLLAPIPYLEQLLALPPYFPVHPAIFKPDVLNPAPAQIVSNGVYRVEAFERGKSLTLAADPTWKGSAPGTPTIILRHFADPAALRDSLRDHQIDLAWRGLPQDDIDIALRNNSIRQTTAPGLQSYYLLIDQKGQPFSDAALRRAMLYLIDRDQAIRFGLRGSGLPLLTLLPPELPLAGSPAYPTLDQPKGVAALDQAGFSKYNRIDSEIALARGIYGDLYASAVDVINTRLTANDAFRTVLDDVARDPFLDRIERGMFRLVIVGWTPLVPHPDAYLHPLLYSTGQLAAGLHYANPALDKLLDQAALESDATKQAALYNEAQTLALQDVIAVPLWQSRQTLVSWDNVEGITVESNYLLRYDQLKIR